MSDAKWQWVKDEVQEAVGEHRYLQLCHGKRVVIDYAGCGTHALEITPADAEYILRALNYYELHHV